MLARLRLLAWVAMGTLLALGCEAGSEADAMMPRVASGAAPGDPDGPAGAAGAGGAPGAAAEWAPGIRADWDDPEAGGAAGDPGTVTATATPASEAPGEVSAPDVDALPEPGAGCVPAGSGEAGPVSAIEHKLEGFPEGLASAPGLAPGVALDGDTLAFGIPGSSWAGYPDRGVVHVFRWGADTAEAVLEAPADGPDGAFGEGVALSGDTLAVRAPGGSLTSLTEGPLPGRVHVFERTGTAWAHVAMLMAETPAERDDFGAVVALEGDTLVATMPREDGGSADVFARDETGFRRVQTLEPIDAEHAVGFGASAALDGDTLAVGAAWSVGGDGQAVHLFRRRDGRWEPDTVLAAPDPGGETFSMRLAMAGGVLAVADTGVDHEAPVGAIREGAVYVYERDCEGGWSLRQTLVPPPEELGSGFGARVAVDGGRIVVANIGDHHAGSGLDPVLTDGVFEDDYTGAVFVYGRTPEGYARVSTLKDTVDVLRENRFGYGLAADAGRILIGTRGEGALYLVR